MKNCNHTCDNSYDVEDQAITNYRYSVLGVVVLAYLLYSIVTVAIS